MQEHVVSTGYLCDGFDLFNVAHLDLIAAATERCERLVVGVLDDDALVARTGRRPIVPLDERVEIVRHVRGVEDVVVHAADSDLSAFIVLVSAEGRSHWRTSVVVLPQTRSSSSSILRRALAPTADDAVA